METSSAEMRHSASPPLAPHPVASLSIIDIRVTERDIWTGHDGEGKVSMKVTHWLVGVRALR